MKVRIPRDQLDVGKALPWDVYNADGRRLFRNGFIFHTQESLRRVQDENKFLTDQIQALLRLDNDKENQLGKQFDLLSKQLAEKEIAYDELFKKHTQLESEYLKTRQ